MVKHLYIQLEEHSVGREVEQLYEQTNLEPHTLVLSHVPEEGVTRCPNLSGFLNNFTPPDKVAVHFPLYVTIEMGYFDQLFHFFPTSQSSRWPFPIPCITLCHMACVKLR